jgi:hypothetical protein
LTKKTSRASWSTRARALCESDLLNGLLVHSASNYAVLLANMVAGSTTRSSQLMNQTAASLGLTGTTYVDVSGYDPGSVSTALDQARLAVLLMKSPLVRSIVDQPSVTLPDAGTVDSFTPYVGTDNVIGVKSGRTVAAGGCDVMAMTFKFGATTRTLYAVVLGQEGGDLLGSGRRRGTGAGELGARRPGAPRARVPCDNLTGHHWLGVAQNSPLGSRPQRGSHGRTANALFTSACGCDIFLAPSIVVKSLAG